MGKGFKETLTGQATVTGAWSTTRDPVFVEKLATTGFDYVCVDLQHGLIGLDSFVAVMTAITGTPAAPLVRVGSNDSSGIGRALDAGACGVIVPLVDSADEARAAVSACRYPPSGVRSFGPTRSHFGTAAPAETDDAVACFVMIETLEGLANVREIAAVPGLTGIYVGPADLAMSFGHAPRSIPTEGPFADALTEIVTVCEAAGVVAGVHAASGGDGRRYRDLGFRMITLLTDTRMFQLAAAEQLADFRSS